MHSDMQSYQKIIQDSKGIITEMLEETRGILSEMKQYSRTIKLAFELALK